MCHSNIHEQCDYCIFNSSTNILHYFSTTLMLWLDKTLCLCNCIYFKLQMICNKNQNILPTREQATDTNAMAWKQSCVNYNPHKLIIWHVMHLSNQPSWFYKMLKMVIHITDEMRSNQNFGIEYNGTLSFSKNELFVVYNVLNKYKILKLGFVCH